MSFVSDLAGSFGSAVGSDLNAQIDAAKSEGQQIAAAVAAWGVVVAIELGILIFFVSRKQK